MLILPVPSVLQLMAQSRPAVAACLPRSRAYIKNQEIADKQLDQLQLKLVSS
jgi:hypothetical protein